MMVTVSIRLEDSYVKQIKILTHKLSLSTGEDMTFNDLIKKTLEEKYPPIEKIPYRKGVPRNEKSKAIQ